MSSEKSLSLAVRIVSAQKFLPLPASPMCILNAVVQTFERTVIGVQRLFTNWFALGALLVRDNNPRLPEASEAQS